MSRGYMSSATIVNSCILQPSVPLLKEKYDIDMLQVITIPESAKRVNTWKRKCWSGGVVKMIGYLAVVGEQPSDPCKYGKVTLSWHHHHHKNEPQTLIGCRTLPQCIIYRCPTLDYTRHNQVIEYCHARGATLLVTVWQIDYLLYQSNVVEAYI